MKKLLLLIGTFTLSMLLSLASFAQASEDFKKATELMDRGDFEEAVPFLDKSIAADPKFFSAFYHRSFIYANLQQYEKALSDIKAAIALKPDNAAFRIIECDYLVKLKRFEEAQVLIESCLKTDLTNSELYMMQAISLKEQNKDGYCNALKNAIKFGNADADELLNQWCK